MGKSYPDAIGKWHVSARLGEGSFGSVYLVSVPVKGSKKLGYAAMKVEKRSDYEVIKMEIYVLEKLQNPNERHQRFFCSIHDRGQTKDFNYLVITLLGKSLDGHRKAQPTRKFSIVSTLKIGIQLMSAFKIFHEAGFVHRDVKPLNMAPGFKRQGMIYVYDFGLARFIYLSERKETLREPRKKVSFRGTHRYCSPNAHKDLDQGRVDDIWGVLYCLTELCTGKLPWTGVPPKEAGEMKVTVKDAVLFKDCPPSFLRIKQQLSKLGFHNRPNYLQYSQWLLDDVRREGGELRSKFEWENGLNTLAKDKSGSDEAYTIFEETNPENGDDDSIRTALAPRAETDEIDDDTLDDLPGDHELMHTPKKLKQHGKPAANKANNKEDKKAAGADKKDESG